MDRVKLPNGFEVSRIIYGMWRLGDDENQSAAHVQQKIESCLSQGITTFDQADIYGDYQSEQILGHALKAAPSLRDKMQIVTKCDIKLLSTKFPERRVKYYDTSAQYITHSVEGSLLNMNIEHIDILLLHRPDPLMDAEETGAALDALINSGKVGAVGVSNFRQNDWSLLQSRMSHALQTNQIELNVLANAALSNGDVAFFQQHNIPLMAWSPLAGGELVSNNIAPEHQALRKRMQSLAEQHGVGEDAIAVAWLLRHPANILPVMGTNNLQRIAQLSSALSVTIDRETWFELYTLANGQEVA